MSVDEKPRHAAWVFDDAMFLQVVLFFLPLK
jgi:hypothetical protein